MKKPPRSESEVFADIATLTRSPGYIHAVAQICYRDNLVAYRVEMRAEDMRKLYSRDRLIRTEITTVLGLMCREPVDLANPGATTVEQYVARTDELMAELHDAMNAPMWKSMLDAAKKGKRDADIWTGQALREPIFYGSESAYTFQYRDLSVEKHEADDAWLVENKGFSIRQAQAIARFMCVLMEEKVARMHTAAREGSPPATWLPAFELAPEEIAFRSRVPLPQVTAFLTAFKFSGDNSNFQSLSDFNALNATPLLPSEGDKVFLFQQYSIYESLYESPFYWMIGDPKYRATAAQNRGAFTESFATKRLSAVFGKDRVRPNVELWRGKGTRVGEIDVLLEFGDRLIIVQAKSKKLTLEARRGNDGQLRKDFAGAIQDSYDQALTCADEILEGDCTLTHGGEALTLGQTPKEIFIFNVVSDHYPALAFQARQFLKYKESERIRPPFVMDVFSLDALTEMLETPLRLLSYARLRTENMNRLMMSHELTALGYHLKRNLWLEPEYNMVMLDDDIATDLDLAMIVRRDGVPGTRTPEGILTRLAGTLYEHLVYQIEKSPAPEALELGFLLLTLGEDTCRNIHQGLEAITRSTQADGKTHDFTLAGDYGGITLHCNTIHSDESLGKLATYCKRRKYAQRARRWFGIEVDTKANLQSVLVFDYEWTRSDQMDADTAEMRKPMAVREFKEVMRTRSRGKIGRNDPCPCGSGMKFKKCCLGKPSRPPWAR